MVGKVRLNYVYKTKKYPVFGYIVGVLLHTTQWVNSGEVIKLFLSQLRFASTTIKVAAT